MKRIAMFLIAAIFGCGGGKAAVPQNDASVEISDSIIEEVSEEVSPDSQESDIEEEGESTEAMIPVHDGVDAGDAEEADAAPQTVADKFVAAGGQQLCEAMLYAMNPDWRANSCDSARTEREREICRRRRAPIFRYAKDICTTSIEESLRLGMDPAMALADMQQESGMGRQYYDREAYVYRIGTDRESLCRMFMPYDRINCGLTGTRDCEGRGQVTRANAKFACWTFGDDNRENCQGVYEVSVVETGVTIDTCLYGEFGVFQLLPANIRAGTVIESTGEVLTGTIQEIERRLVHDVTLQVRLGFQELARHRDVAPEGRRTDWWDWLPIYNIGKDCLLPGADCSDKAKAHWWVYLRNISGHYSRACRGWMPGPNAATVISVEDVWPECQRIEALRERLDSNEEE